MLATPVTGAHSSLPTTAFGPNRMLLGPCSALARASIRHYLLEYDSVGRSLGRRRSVFEEGGPARVLAQRHCAIRLAHGPGGERQRRCRAGRGRAPAPY